MSAKQGSPMSVDITDAARASLKRLCVRLGMKQKDVTERALEWLARQHDDLQAAIMGHLSKPTTDRILAEHLHPLGAAGAAEDEAGAGAALQHDKPVRRRSRRGTKGAAA